MRRPKAAPLPVKAEAPVVTHISPALAPLMAEAEQPMPSRRGCSSALGIERLADYQDVAYARDYLDRLKPIAEIDKRHGDGSGQLLAETARELALGMAYEDTVRVAELKIRPSRFERVRAEVAGGRRPDRRDRGVPASRACRRSPTRCRRVSAAGC